MEELALVAAVLALLALVAGVPALAVAVFVIERRRTELARRVERLERELGRTGSPTQPPAPIAPAPPREPVKPPPVLPFPAPAPLRTTPSPVVPPAPPRARIDWERWIGIRGAAVLGGVVLALAGLLFVQYSIQRGWISPAVRCAMAAAVGAAAIAGSHWLAKRDYAVTASSLAGAGATILYAATWAARMLYELVPAGVALAVMVAITALCGGLAVKRRSQLIAIFGLLGGFATPLLLSLGGDEPLGLFGYLLLLDIAVLALGRTNRWPLLGLLAAIASPLLFLVWLVRAPASAPPLAALAFCGLTSIAFAVGSLDPAGERRAWPWARGVGVLSSFAFAAYFAAKTETPIALAPLGVLLAALAACTLWVDWKRASPALVLGAALGATATMLVSALAGLPKGSSGWPLAGVAVLVAVIAHASFELRARRGDALGAFVCDPWSVFAIGGLVVSGIAGERGTAAIWPWLAGASVASLSIARQTGLGVRAWIHVAGATLAALVFVAARHGESDPLLLPPAAIELALLAGLVAFAALPLALAEREPVRAAARWAVVAVAIALMLERGFLTSEEEVRPAFALGAVAGLLAVGLAAMRNLPSIAFGAVALAAWPAELQWADYVLWDKAEPSTVLAIVALSWLALAAGPRLRARERRAAPWAWRFGAAAVTAWTMPFAIVMEGAAFNVPDSFALALGTAIALAVTLALRQERAHVGFAWFSGATALLAALAVAIEVDCAPDLAAAAFVAVGWSACARLAGGHGGLRWLALAAATYAALRMPIEVAKVAVDPTEHLRSGYALVHWLAYVTLLPSLALLATSRLLVPPADATRGPWKVLSSLTALAGTLGLFLSLNVEVVNLFSRGSEYDFTLDRKPARDVALSIAWAVFAISLLVLGARRHSSPLRWTSLVFLLATIAKVFLYDMGELTGLHRVASLVGLAISLLAVSLFYQRFVFRPASGRTPPPSGLA